MNKIDILKKLLENSPEDADKWFLLGIELSLDGNRDEAVKAFTQALIYADTKLKDKVFTELGKLVSENPKDAQSSDYDNFTDTIAPETDDDDVDVVDIVEDEDDDADNDVDDVFDIADVNDNVNNGNNTGLHNEETENTRAKLKVLKGGENNYSNPSLEVIKPVIDFSDVGGLNELKDNIKMRIIKPFSNPGLFSKFKKKIGGGLLLYGPPGCGKTFIAKATAGECSAKFIPVHITDILDPYIGMSERNIREIFSNARAKRPCILFFDEIDTIGYNRSKMTSEHMRSVIDQLLTEIEGIDSSTDKMLIIGATNMPWDVDPALKRPGRFDKAVFVPPPDLPAREAIFKLKIADRPYDDSIDFSLLARNSELFSGADIENVIEMATESVISEIMKTGNERPIRMQDVADSLANTKPSTIEWLRTIKNYVKYSNQTGLYDDVDKYLNKIKKFI